MVPDASPRATEERVKGAVTGTRTRAGGTTTHRANRYTITAAALPPLYAISIERP